MQAWASHGAGPSSMTQSKSPRKSYTQRTRSQHTSSCEVNRRPFFHSFRRRFALEADAESHQGGLDIALSFKINGLLRRGRARVLSVRRTWASSSAWRMRGRFGKKLLIEAEVKSSFTPRMPSSRIPRISPRNRREHGYF